MLWPIWQTPICDGYKTAKQVHRSMLWVFRCLYVVYWFVNAFVHQQVKRFMHKKSKICIYKLIWQSFNHHIQLWQVDNWANVI